MKRCITDEWRGGRRGFRADLRIQTNEPPAPGVRGRGVSGAPVERSLTARLFSPLLGRPVTARRAGRAKARETGLSTRCTDRGARRRSRRPGSTQASSETRERPARMSICSPRLTADLWSIFAPPFSTRVSWLGCVSDSAPASSDVTLTGPCTGSRRPRVWIIAPDDRTAAHLAHVACARQRRLVLYMSGGAQRPRSGCGAEARTSHDTSAATTLG